MNDNATYTLILNIMLIIMLVLLVIFCILYFKSKKSKNKSNATINNYETKEKKVAKNYSIESIFDFMEFDRIEDNMIITKNGNKLWLLNAKVLTMI